MEDKNYTKQPQWTKTHQNRQKLPNWKKKLPTIDKNSQNGLNGKHKCQKPLAEGQQPSTGARRSVA